MSLLALHALHLSCHFAPILDQISPVERYITLGTPIFYQTELGQISESDLIKPTLDKIFQHIGRVTFESAHAGNVLF